MQWNFNPTKTSFQFSEQCSTFSQLWRHIPLQWKMWYLFPVMETDYSIPLITVCSETSTQQKLLPTSVNNVVIFFSYGDKLLNTFNYCIQWNLNQTKNLTTSVNNVVLFSRYGDRSHFSEQCGTFFQLWIQITQHL